MVEYSFTSLGGWSLTSGPIDIKPLPSEQTSINRPRTWAEHRHTDGKDRQKDMNPRVPVRSRVERKRHRNLVQCEGRSYERCPQTSEHKNARHSRNQVLREPGCLRGSLRKTGHCAIDERDGDTNPEQEQPNSRPAIRKR
jgi:hypothetical protein